MVVVLLHPFGSSLASKGRGGELHKEDCAFCKLCKQKVAHGGRTTHNIVECNH